MRSRHSCVVLAKLAVVLAVVVPLCVAVGTRPHVPPFGAAVTAAEQDAAAVEVALGLDRPTRRLIQQGLSNEGFDPGVPAGLFGPRTRAAIRDWQVAHEFVETGYLDEAQAETLRTAGAPVAASVNGEPLDASATATAATSATSTESDQAAGPDLQQTPLHFAARYGGPRVVEALLTAGANVAARTDRDATPLRLAAEFNEKPCRHDTAPCGWRGCNGAEPYRP